MNEAVVMIQVDQLLKGRSTAEILWCGYEPAATVCHMSRYQCGIRQISGANRHVKSFPDQINPVRCAVQHHAHFRVSELIADNRFCHLCVRWRGDTERAAWLIILF